MHRLITLSFSHYNDKARWALQYCGVPFREERHMPGFSSAAVALATRGRGGRADRVSTRFSTPVLICADGQHVADSTDIAKFASSQATPARTLFPSAEVDELVQRFGDRLGPYTRLVAYFHALRHDGLLQRLANRNVTRREARLFSLVYPVGKRALSRSLGLSRDSAERATERIDDEVAFAMSRLGASGFLVGDHFTAADLTFAAMLAPAILVSPEEGYGGALPTIDELDLEAQTLVARYRDQAAGEYALRMYREHRPVAPLEF